MDGTIAVRPRPLQRRSASRPLAPDPTSAQQLVDALGRFRDLGITMSAVPIPPVASVEAYLDHAQWVMEEVKPHV